ncbi:hypothetical protein SDC9_112525 [bioreactor metagenome]|uniref:Uncharacterized protein n=1 Tax=bioreactor metagenome TaxID=1076179 RepID=A0A645BKK3_9ZZZZ
MGVQECDLEHVVAAIGIVGIRNVILTQADQHVLFLQFTYTRMQRAGVRIADNAHVGFFEQGSQLLQIRFGIHRHGSGMVG